MERTRNGEQNVETLDESTSQEFSSPWHFSDVVLVVEGTRFHVHKSTLSMWSPVFRTMFTPQFLENTANRISLPGKRAHEVEQLLKVIYSADAKQEVTEKNYEFLLKLAREYQMDKVHQYCAQFMGQGIDDLNCLHRYKNAERYGFEDVMKKCNEEARLKFSYELEDNVDFRHLGFESKFKVCMARMKDLEDVLIKYSEICSDLVHGYYGELDESTANGKVPLTFQCNNKASHEYHSSVPNEKKVRKTFDSSCKYCRKRMVSRYQSELAPVNALHFDDNFIELYDLEFDDKLANLIR